MTLPTRRRRRSATPSKRRRSTRRPIPRPALSAPSTRLPAILSENERGARFGRRCDRQLGRHLRAVVAASVSAARPARPPDRLLAFAVALLVVVGARRRRRPCPRAEPLAPRSVLRRCFRHAWRRLHL